MRLRNRLGDAALLLGAVLIAGFAARRGINPHDEGLMLAAADRIVHGQLPWRDFWWNYGPAEPFLLAGLQELVGVSLLAWRVVHVLVAAVAALLAYRLVRREAPMALALAAWLAVVAALSYPLTPNPIGPALLLALAGLVAAPRRPLLAGALTGLALTFRLDVGAAAVLAVALACWRPSLAATERSGMGVLPNGEPQMLDLADDPASELRRDRVAVGRALAGAAAVAFAVLAPLAIAGGVVRFLDQTVGFALSDQSRQRLPLPLDGDGTARLNGTFEHVFPTLVLAAFGLWIAIALVQLARGAGPPRGLALSALPLAFAGALYVLARADEFHVVVLQATLPLLAASTLAAELRRGRESPASTDTPVVERDRWSRRLTVAATTLAVTLPLVYGLDRKGSQLVHPPTLVAIHLNTADGVRAEPREAGALSQLVPAVRELTAPSESVFVANPRHDLVRVGNPLVSVLIGRPNPTRYPIMQPGVVTERGVQQEMVRGIRHASTPVVVRWLSPVADQREPNASGHSSHVHVLDRYLARTYRPLRRIGDYQLLVLR